MKNNNANKKQNKKIDSKLLIIIGIIIAIVGIVISYIIINHNKSSEPVDEDRNGNLVVRKGYEKLDTKHKIYDNYEEYYYMYINLTDEEKEKYIEMSEEDFKENNILVIYYNIDYCNETIKKFDYKSSEDRINVYYDLNHNCGVCIPEKDIKTIKIDKNIKKVYTYYKMFSEKRCDQDIVYKPIMYIYPEKDMDLTIKFKTPDLLTYTYPKYNDLWNVHVTKDSNIYDYNTDRNYYGLYWEAIDNTKLDMSTGFVVSGEETVEFLEEKLEYLGLNEREINEFIVYWIDKLDNNYNYIYFRTTDEVNKYMPLEFSEEPDTLIRIIVDIKPLDEIIEVKEQQLTKVERNGYTIVEWGGTIHK